MEYLWITGLIALVFSSWASSKQQYIMEAPDCRTCPWDWDTSASLPINGTLEGHDSKINSVCSRCHLNVHPFLTELLAGFST